MQSTSAGITFAIKLHPRAKKNAITGRVGDALKLSLTAPPVDGKANAACIEFFAKLLKVPRSSVTIAAGETGRNKVICISGVNAAQVQERLKH
jgi:uncharacterized protein (TIGR00251 family)